jgi:hypothetical protein
MTSLKKFYSLSKKEQDYEIERTCYILELLYSRYKESGVILLRGQYWKIEKYLLLYLYLQAQKEDGAKIF